MSDKAKYRANQKFAVQLAAAGVPYEGFSQTAMDYGSKGTTEQRATGDALHSAFNWSTEEALAETEIEAEEQLSAFDRQNILARANDILAEAAAGIAACDADLATIATGKAANTAAGTIAQLRTVQGGILDVMQRKVTRQKSIIRAVEDITKLIRHLAK